MIGFRVDRAYRVYRVDRVQSVSRVYRAHWASGVWGPGCGCGRATPIVSQIPNLQPEYLFAGLR